jgi:hypothetical protein
VVASHVAKVICLAVGALAAWNVHLQVSDVFTDPRWLSWAAGAGALLVVFALLYFPLVRPLAEAAGDRLDAARLRVRATRTGTGLDEVPLRRLDDTQSRMVVCARCGGPGGPVCDRCHAELTSRSDRG